MKIIRYKSNNLVSTAALFVIAILIALFTKVYIVQPYVVDGQSMETTLQNNDRLLVNKLPLTFSHFGHKYVPNRGDIIIFNQAGLPGYNSSKMLIKRVIGLPGERVVIKDGSITVYNASHPKGFNPDTDTGYRLSAASTIGNLDTNLASDQIFVCGDNRNNSEDSRYFGPVNLNQIAGKLAFRILPLGKAQHF